MLRRVTKQSYRNNLYSRLSGGRALLWNYVFLKNNHCFLDKVSMGSYLKKKNGFLKVLIIRGIGYRAFITMNDFSLKHLNGFFFQLFYDRLLCSKWADENLAAHDFVYINNILLHELVSSFYLTLRVGHTSDSNWQVKARISITKKNRKLVLLSNLKSYVSFLANCVWGYRKPSVYTGRGVRKKKIPTARKEGKKDQKGRGF